MLANLILSGGGVRSYAHLGVYKYCFENKIKFGEIVAVSGGSLVAPFIYLNKDPDKTINLFKKAKLHEKLFPFYFIPDRFEFLFIEPSTYKLGKWVEEQFSLGELSEIKNSKRLHIMATKIPMRHNLAEYTDMLLITDLKNAISASCAISGIFKEHKVGSDFYIDGTHWNNVPIFFNFAYKSIPLITVSLSYCGTREQKGSKISKIMRGVEIASCARFIEDVERWNIEKRGELVVINPVTPLIHPLDFNLKESEIDEVIKLGYESAREVLSVRALHAKSLHVPTAD